MLKLPIARLDELFSLISAERELYLPLEENGVVNFGRWAPGAEPKLDHLNTARPVKDFFFAMTEDIASFKLKGKEIEVVEDRVPTAPFALFGVRACDAASLDILDKVFLSDPVDTFYQARRDQGVVITAACNAPEEICFCTAFPIDAADPGGDVATWRTADALYWAAKTDKGAALTEKVKHLFEDAGSAGEQAVAERKAAIKEILDRLPLGDISLEGFTGEALMEMFDSPEWKKLYEPCIACGTCTYICPPCHCYDIRDFDTGRGICRTRCWDSCMYSDFTLMAHGNPRTTQLERFRQRYMHKLIYFPDNNDGVYACVGCGRCVAKCPASMNIVKVIKALGVNNHV